MFLKYITFLACVLIVHSIPLNNAPIISTYAKVARWGAVSSTTTEAPSEARSHHGQTLWTHRSDVNIIGGQNLKNSKPKVVYQYAIHKVGQEKEPAPGVGEVQERFNPRPYFDYTQVPSKQSSKNDKPKSKPSSSQSNPPTFDSFPVFNPPSPPSDVYSSQYSSYNPPNAGPISPPDDSKPDVSYPPNGSPPPDNDNTDSDNGYHYNPPQPQDAPPAPQGPPQSYPSLGPPLAPSDSDSDDKPHFYPPADNGNDQKHHGFYGHDDKEQVYYPPSDDGNPHETILDHPPPGWQDSKQNMPPAPPDMAPDMGNMNGAPMAMNGGMNGNGHDMAEHDLAPPPQPQADFGGQFPPYLYNGAHGHDFDYNFDDHHVYKEVTTTEAPEDERVNKGHYSYYYLGRKLWYVPLYFSVYFIIYVTVLILKSIARHKIQFKHNYFHGKDMSKDMDHHGRSLDIDNLHENVTKAIETSRRKFTYVVM